MMKSLLLTLSILLSLTTFSQNFRWVKGLGSIDHDLCKAITLDHNRNIYTVGQYGDSLFYTGNDSTGIKNIGDPDIYITKQDFAGNTLWVKTFTGYGERAVSDITVDDSDNVYVVGNFTGNTDFDPDSGQQVVSNVNNPDLFLTKLNASGQLVWVKTIGGVNNSVYATKMVTDSKGYFYITGSFSGIVDFDPGPGVDTLKAGNVSTYNAFIVKLDHEGNYVQAKNVAFYGGFVSLCIQPNGDLLFAGNTSGTADFDPGPATYNLTTSLDDIFLLKLDSSMNFSWAKLIGGPKHDFVRAMITDAAGNIYMAGASGTFQLNAFISKYSSSGTLIRTNLFTGIASEATSVSLDRLNNLYFSGIFQGNIDIDPGPGVSTLIQDQVYLSQFFLRVDTSFTMVWGDHLKMSEAGAGYDALGIITTDPVGNIYSTGTFGNVGYQDFDMGPDYSMLYTKGVQDVFILRISNCNQKITTQPQYQNAEEGDTLSYTIAASKSTAHFQWQIKSGTTFIDLQDSGHYSGTHTSTFTVSNIETSSSGYLFRCIVSDITCSDSLISDTIACYPQCKPAIIQEPVDAHINPGSTALFTIASNKTVNSYSWQIETDSGFYSLSDDDLFSGTMTDSLLVKDVSLLQDGFHFRCVVFRSNCNDSSHVATLHVSCGLSITMEAKDTLVDTGEPVLFIISASSVSATFQWQQDTGTGFTDVVNGLDYQGADNDTLTILHATISLDSSVYRCIIGENGCADTSSVVVLKIKDDPTGINELDANTGLRVYPNPTRNSVIIEIGDMATRPAYSIMNTTGMILKEGILNNKITPIDITTYPPGLYFIKVEGNNKCYKIMKE